MCRLALLAALSLSVCVGSIATAGDDLFSEVPIDSVFTPPGQKPANSTKPQPPVRRIAGASSLTSTLLAAGFQPKEVGDSVVAIKMQRDSLTIPVLVTVTDDGSQLWMVMQLAAVADEQALPSVNLLTLLAANRENPGTTFAYSAKNKRIELHRSMSNVGVSGSQLRAELEKMANIASEMQTAWTPTATPTEVSKVPSTTPQQSETPQAPATQQPTLSLVGKWSASKSAKDAMALQLNADGSFLLVVVRNSKPVKSQGRYTIVGSLLTLVDTKGTKIAGTITMQGKQFDLALQGVPTGSAPLRFKKSP